MRKKNLYLYLCMVLAVLLLNSPATACGPGCHQLVVVNGSGGGLYEEGDHVHIWANPEPFHQGVECPDDAKVSFVFEGWKGDTEYILNGSEDYGIQSWHAIVQMPARERVRLRAIYKKVRQWEAERGEAGDTAYYYYFPPTTKAIMVLLHGSGGEAANWTETRKDLRRFVERAVANGYGIVALESVNRDGKIWSFNPPPYNPDLKNAAVIMNQLQDAHDLHDLPLTTVGISAGGYFASMLTHFDTRFVGQALFIAGGIKQIFLGNYGLPHTPTLWLMAENEDVITPPFWPFYANRDAQNHQEILENFEVANDLVWLHPSALHEQRFWRLCGLTRADSKRIYSAISKNELLNAHAELAYHPLYPAGLQVPPEIGWSFPPPADGTPWSEFYWDFVIPTYGMDMAQSIWRELSQLYARHIFFNEYDHRTLDFFNHLIEQ